MNKNSKKTCIVHNADATRCGCPDSASQADFRRTVSTIPELPPIAKMAGEKPMAGPITVTWETKRLKDGSFYSKCVEAKNATETRRY